MAILIILLAVLAGCGSPEVSVESSTSEVDPELAEYVDSFISDCYKYGVEDVCENNMKILDFVAVEAPSDSKWSGYCSYSSVWRAVYINPEYIMNWGTVFSI